MNEHYPFVLPPLPYRYYALEPYLEEQTIRIHHDTLFQGYVDRLNAALQKYPRFQRWNLERLIVDNDRLPVEIRTTVYNNAGGVYNHDAYFAAMTPKYRRPSNYMRNVLEESFGSFENFKEQMLNAGLRVFGSGWAWLVLKGDKLAVVSTANQDSPLMGEAISGASGFPIMGLDVWEHAYYLKFQNRRPDYIKEFWNVVNWDEAAARFAAKK